MSKISEITAGASLINKSLMEEVRSKFHYVDECPYAGKRIYFESAGGSLTLKSVVEHSSMLSAVPDNEHRNNPASLALTKIVSKGIEDLKTFFGAKSGVVFGGETGSECLFRLVRSASMAARSGGSILSSAVEHPSTYSATQIWAKNTNRDWIDVPFNTQTSVVSAEDYAAFVRPDTRVATVIHTNPVTGVVMDVKAIVDAIRAIAPECFIIVDGIQHAPHGYLDVESYGADAYVLSLYKMYSKFNNGYAWVSERMSIIPHDRLIGKPDSVWELGSRDPSALVAITEVVNYLAWLGGRFTQKTSTRDQLHVAGKIMQHHEHGLISTLFNGTKKYTGLLNTKGITMVGTTDIKQREGVVAFSVEGWSATDLVALLGERGIRIHARSNDLYSGNILRPLGLESVARVSFAHYNTQEEIEFFLEQLLGIIKK
ncbi:aminotransferase class V-fold PLP-dependent enzyme [Marinomonas sp. C2222]|uniref:Aminotransferase class V-fold PLP-dependent enzyme n=1 Tax=Marinomonas sargassi TaxID=2984494 RepID=A0ABT2YUT9_9GAMM|nr:aminotransferase class V-fold PLP-dependent enzyme [Marinomonas sargassi]MCV2403667.1 aminotransferase class V-fold PLP-dependent enzyme [Marinomonas sargassi]